MRICIEKSRHETIKPLESISDGLNNKNLLPLDEMSCAFETERQNEK